LGESEKLVRALFTLAKAFSPSIIFVDEIDSLLSSRSGGENENEASRRLKTEFLIQLSSLASAAAARESEDSPRVLVLAATNLPWAIDDAARRRFVLRQYIPLPEAETRSVQFGRLLSRQHHTVTEEQLEQLVALTDGLPP
jgi:fidgetin-like protein 1